MMNDQHTRMPLASKTKIKKGARSALFYMMCSDPLIRLEKMRIHNRMWSEH